MCRNKDALREAWLLLFLIVRRTKGACRGIVCFWYDRPRAVAPRLHGTLGQQSRIEALRGSHRRRLNVLLNASLVRRNAILLHCRSSVHVHILHCKA